MTGLESLRCELMLILSNLHCNLTLKMVSEEMVNTALGGRLRPGKQNGFLKQGTFTVTLLHRLLLLLLANFFWFSNLVLFSFSLIFNYITISLRFYIPFQPTPTSQKPPLP